MDGSRRRGDCHGDIRADEALSGGCLGAAWLFASGPDFDITFGLAHTIEKSAEIYIKVLSAGQGKIRQTITDDDLRAIAHDFGVTINEKFLD